MLKKLSNKSLPKRKIICILLLAILFTLWFIGPLSSDSGILSIRIGSDDEQIEDRDDSKHRKHMIAVECILPQLNPWDASIQPFLEVVNSKNCNRTFPNITKLLNGYVVMEPEAQVTNTSCQFRCLYPGSDHEYLSGNWSNLSLKPDCDVIEMKCTDYGNSTYNYLHLQIYRKEEKKNENTNSVQPNVHLLILDSVSHSNFLRSMPRSLNLLNKMGAVQFPHLNKVGYNSQPNGYAMFFGFQTTPIAQNIMNTEGYKPPRDLHDMGQIYLDEEPFIAFEYSKMGYQTMMGEDSEYSHTKAIFIAWPDGKGFKRSPTDHYLRPFQIRVFEEDDEKLKSTIMEESCRESYQYILQYFANFIDAYPEKPKFSILWTTSLTHCDVNALQKMDVNLYQFLMDYEQRPENSFLFIMGDHGLRFGKIRETQQGEIEDNNPALFLTLPKYLRNNNKLLSNLRENAGQLVTHFDIHATLLNIAKENSEWSTDFPFEKSSSTSAKTSFGESLLYAFDKMKPRNCGTQMVPIEFCLCQFEQWNITESGQNLAKKLATMMVAKMNADIIKMKATARCAKLELKPEADVEIIEYIQNKRNQTFYKVNFQTFPGNGHFSGYARADDRNSSSEGFSIISSRIARLNKFEKNQAECADDFSIAPYCHCKE